jgi:hypothetical protein
MRTWLMRALLRRRFRGLFSDAKLHGVAVGIEDEQRFFDRARCRVSGDTFPAELLLLGFAGGRREIVGGDLEAPNDALQPARGGRRQSKVLQRDAEAGMIRHCKKHNHRHFTIETARVQIGVKAETRAHEA